jgi:hypothetical protein
MDGRKSKKPVHDDNDDDAPNLGAEEAEQRAAQLFPEAVLKGLGSAAWKERLQAMQDLAAAVERAPPAYRPSGADAPLARAGMSVDERDANADLIVRYVLKKQPGFADTNLQVAAKVFETVVLLASSTTTLARKTVAAVVPEAAAKLGEAKLKAPIGAAFTAFAEATTLQFVAAQLYKALVDNSNPRVATEALSWLGGAVAVRAQPAAGGGGDADAARTGLWPRRAECCGACVVPEGVPGRQGSESARGGDGGGGAAAPAAGAERAQPVQRREARAAGQHRRRVRQGGRRRAGGRAHAHHARRRCRGCACDAGRCSCTGRGCASLPYGAARRRTPGFSPCSNSRPR